MAAEILKALYVFSFSLGLWTCINMLVHKQGPREVRCVLLFFIAVLLVIPLNGYLALVAEEPWFLINSLATTLTWSYAPLLYILVNSVVTRHLRMRHAALHFIPFVTMAALHFFKLEWLTLPGYLSLLLLQIGIYLTVSVRILLRYRTRIITLGREFRNSAYYWMLYLVAGLFMITLYDTGLMLLLHYGVAINFFFVSTTVCAFSIYISTISFFLMLQPDAFNRESAVTEPADPGARPEEEKMKLRNVELSNDAALELKERLDRLMMEYKPHLDTDVSLSKLASLLGVSNHQLSELLNIHMETSFYDFLNGLRYREAITLMHSQPGRYSVTDIAYLSGFNNRNTFYRVFKKHNGVTPGEYRRHRMEAGSRSGTTNGM